MPADLAFIPLHGRVLDESANFGDFGDPVGAACSTCPMAEDLGVLIIQSIDCICQGAKITPATLKVFDYRLARNAARRLDQNLLFLGWHIVVRLYGLI